MNEYPFQFKKGISSFPINVKEKDEMFMRRYLLTSQRQSPKKILSPKLFNNTMKNSVEIDHHLLPGNPKTPSGNKIRLNNFPREESLPLKISSSSKHLLKITGLEPIKSKTNTANWFNKEKMSQTSRQCQNIYQSLSYYQHRTENILATKINESNKNYDEIVLKTCQIENMKLQKILQNLIKQKADLNLPKLSISGRKIDFSSFTNSKGLNKYLGEKYDPGNYQVVIKKPNPCILIKTKFGKY